MEEVASHNLLLELNLVDEDHQFMGVERLELSRAYKAQRILSPQRLPFRHTPLISIGSGLVLIETNLSYSIFSILQHRLAEKLVFFSFLALIPLKLK